MSEGLLGAVKCDRCGAYACDWKEAHWYGWDWFQGYLPETEHYCRPCQEADPQLIERRYRISRNKETAEAEA